jgi:hypothetical protein
MLLARPKSDRKYPGYTQCTMLRAFQADLESGDIRSG